MYQKITDTASAKKLPLVQQSIAVEAGTHRFWTNTGKQVLELQVIKTPEEA